MVAVGWSAVAAHFNLVIGIVCGALSIVAVVYSIRVSQAKLRWMRRQEEKEQKREA